MGLWLMIMASDGWLWRFGLYNMGSSSLVAALAHFDIGSDHCLAYKLIRSFICIV